MNKAKTALVKQHVLQQNTKYLIPMVLITDADESGWNKISENEESVDFLPTSELLSLIDNDAVPEEFIRKCIDMDDAYQLRCALEKLAIQTSIKNIMPADLSRLEGQFERFKKQLEQGGYGVSLEELTRADWELHDLIINKSDNCLLASAIERATLLLRRYQYTYISSYSKATCEHLDIIHGIMEKDVEKVTDILDKHLRYRPL